MYHPDQDDQEDERDIPLYGTELSPGDMSNPDAGLTRYADPIGFLVEEGFDDSVWLEDKSYFRVKTAPARPLTEIEEFRKSKTTMIMERAVVSSTHLIQTYNNHYDIDSLEGQMACKTFLNLLEKLHECFKTNTASREYRKNFSKAYRILYQDDSLCYLTEILDSAQEAVPCLYVNGTRYEFTSLVLEAGHKLFQSFIDIQHLTRKNFLRATYETSNNCVSTIKSEMTRALESFDNNWATYEKYYVKELMGIEAEARKYITDAIKIEKQLQALEDKEKAKGRILLESEAYDDLRKDFAQQIAQINSVANEDGKGRDDLSIDILIAAEGILRRISPSQSMSVRKLAENIRSSFMNLRLLLRKYDMNVEIVDPQLKNNQDLVNELMLYEKYWERGKQYFLNGKRCAQLIHFSNTLEGLCEKYSQFKDLVEYRDADVFMMIPMIMVLKSIEKNDKGICEFFLPDIKKKETELGKMYEFIKESVHESNYKLNNQKKELNRRDRSLGRSVRFSRKSPGGGSQHKSIGKKLTKLDHLEKSSYFKGEKESNSMFEGPREKKKWGMKNLSSSMHPRSPDLMKSDSHYKTLLRNKKQYATFKRMKEGSSKMMGSKQKAAMQAKVVNKFNYKLYNVLEKKILDIDLTSNEKEVYEESSTILDGAIHKIKILSIQLERNNPMEWNTFLDVALES